MQDFAYMHCRQDITHFLLKLMYKFKPLLFPVFVLVICFCHIYHDAVKKNGYFELSEVFFDSSEFFFPRIYLKQIPESTEILLFLLSSKGKLAVEFPI